MSEPEVPRGFKSIATRAGAEVEIEAGGWVHARHPVTKAILQRDPSGFFTVHAAHGSFHEGSNTKATLLRIWKGIL